MLDVSHEDSLALILILLIGSVPYRYFIAQMNGAQLKSVVYEQEYKQKDSSWSLEYSLVIG